MGIKEISKGGASVDLVLTYLDSDVECFREVPYAIREYMNTMREPPRPAIVLQSIQQFGARATMLALREKEQLDSFTARAEEAQRSGKVSKAGGPHGTH